MIAANSAFLALGVVLVAPRSVSPDDECGAADGCDRLRLDLSNDG